MIKYSILIAIIFTLSTSSCNPLKLEEKEKNNLKSTTQADTELKGIQWKINDTEKQFTEGLASKCNITFTDTTIAGNSGCNSFSGSIEKLTDRKIKMKSGFMQTKRYCAEIKDESNFLSILASSNQYKIVGDELFLYVDDKLVLKFKK